MKERIDLLKKEKEWTKKRKKKGREDNEERHKDNIRHYSILQRRMNE